MKFLVTGGAGFIGHNVVRQLEQAGHECCVLDCVTDYGFVPQDELAYLYRERVKRIQAHIYHVDLRNASGVANWFAHYSQGADAVIHLASFPRQKVVSANPVWGAEVMGTGLVNLLELTKQYNIPKFVYISSSMVYGNFNDDVKEDYNCKPQGQYGIMKLMGENLVKDYTRRGCFDHVILRPSAVYGPLDVEDRVVSKFMLTAMRGGVLKVNGSSETLDFTYVDDAADGVVAAALVPAAANQTFNITKSHSVSLLQAAEMILKIVANGSIELRDKDADFPSRGALNIDRARAVLGYDPQVDVAEGFDNYHAWFKSSLYWAPKTV